LCVHIARKTSPKLTANRLITEVRQDAEGPHGKASPPWLSGAMTGVTVRRDGEHRSVFLLQGIA